MPTAREVVEAYLAKTQRNPQLAAQDEIVNAATKSVVEFLPDGFTKKDVRACVKTLLEEHPDLEGYKPYRRTSVTNKVVDTLQKDGAIVAKDGGKYVHVAF